MVVALDSDGDDGDGDESEPLRTPRRGAAHTPMSARVRVELSDTDDEGRERHAGGFVPSAASSDDEVIQRWEKSRIVTLDFGREMSSRPFRDARRFPSTRLYRVLRCTRTPRKLGLCPSFKGHSLSPRAKP